MYTMKMYAIIASKGYYEDRYEWTVFISQDKNAAMKKVNELKEFDSFHTDSETFYSLMEYTLDGTGMVTETHCI